MQSCFIPIVKLSSLDHAKMPFPLTESIDSTAWLNSPVKSCMEASDLALQLEQ